MLGELLDGAVRAGPDPHGCDEARQHEREIPQRLAARQLRLALPQHHRVAAELAHADLEGHPRAGGGPLEDQRDGPACERLRRVAVGLEVQRAVEQ